MQFVPFYHTKVLVNSAVQKTVDLPQIQHIQRIIDFTAVMRHQAPSIESAQKMLEVRQSQYLYQVADVLL